MPQLPVTATQDVLWADDPQPADEEPSRRLPDLTPVSDYLGLKTGARIEVLWTEGADPVPAVVVEPRTFGALVTVDPTADPGWSCGPFDMYVTHQCSDGTWCR